MEPDLVLRHDIDPLEHSPLVRGLVLSMSYAEENAGIGLTKSGAMNRKFVHWAAGRFEWPGYTRDELFSMNKVLNEIDMPPLWPVHDLLLHLKLMRRYKGTLKVTRRGRDLMARSGDLFDLAAPAYLYGYVHDDRGQERGGVLGNWRIFLNVINIEARTGCTTAELMKTLYGREQVEKDDPDYQETRFALKFCLLRPLCWLGLLWEDREGLGFFDEGTFYKTPLWPAALTLESDAQAALRLI
jgi:hypothetical protein